MKVITEKVWFTFTCKACGSVCEAEPEDAMARVESYDCDGDPFGYHYFVECGKCGYEVPIPSEKQTKKVTGLAHAKGRRGGYYGSY
jgi:transcription elongation factor Elf1